MCLIMSEFCKFVNVSKNYLAVKKYVSNKCQKLKIVKKVSVKTAENYQIMFFHIYLCLVKLG